MRPLLAALLLLATTLQAQPLADRIPADALLYAGWAGSDALAPAYANSHLKGVVDASNLPALFADLGPAITRRLELEKNSPLEAFTKNVLPTLLSTGESVWHHPTALYVGPLNLTAKVPLPRLAILCSAGKDAQAMVDSIGKLIAQLAPNAPLQ